MTKLGFYHKDEFGTATKVIKEYDDCPLQTNFERIVEEFKNFLLAVGFSPNTVDCLDIVEREDD
jgi:hypothetical protein